MMFLVTLKMDKDTRDIVVLITGANRGIGYSIFETFYQHGYKVAGSYRSDSGEDSLKKIIDDNDRGMAVQLDVTSTDSITEATKKIQEKFGDIGILINNAGITNDNLFMRMKEDEWNNVIDTNLNSVFRVTKECVKGMIKQRYGRIINVSSVVGLTGNPGQVNYSSSKSAIYGFTKSLARELASRNITANSISPGFIQTDMTDKLTDEQTNAITKSIPLSRLGSAKDVADLALFLASDQASYITGENINVNGGLYM